MALRFNSGIAGVPELTSAEAFVEFEKNVSDGSVSGEVKGKFGSRAR